MATQEGPLTRKRVLIVEDEALIAMAVQEEIHLLGSSETHIAPTSEAALAAIAALKPDFAVIDVNLLDVGEDYAVADALARQGIPFIFSSGHLAGELPDRHVGRPFVSKPMQLQDLRDAVTSALSASSIDQVSELDPSDDA